MNKCGACGKFTSTAGGAACAKCKIRYHKTCVSIGSGDSVQKGWICPCCSVKLPRRENTNTPPGATSLNTSFHDCMLPLSTENAAEDNSCENVDDTIDKAVILRFMEEIRLCRGQMRDTTKAMVKFRAELADIRLELSTCKEKIQAIEELHETFYMTQKSNSNSISLLESTVAELRKDLHGREQDILSNDIEIIGIPENGAENLFHIANLVIVEEALCPRGACVACVSTAVAAHEFRVFVRSAAALWARAAGALLAAPRPGPPARALGLVVSRGSLAVRAVTDYIGDRPLQILNRLRERAEKKPPRKRRAARPGAFACGDCGKAFTSPALLAQHLNCSAQKDACLTCGQVLLRGAPMKEHLAAVHHQRVFHCNDCTSLFKSLDDLDEHMKAAHAKGALTCGDCGRTFKRSGTLEAHTQMHAVRTCRACGRQFTNRGCYRAHRAQCEPDAVPDVRGLPRSRRCNVRDPASFTCDYCGKTYRSRPQLKNHIVWIHMDVRPHECRWCRKRFYTPGRLAEHSVVHTRVRNFACDICGMKLVSKMAVVYHRRRHTGEKPYACQDCGERFISASRRSEHAKRKHRRGNLLQCLQCAESFVRGTDLRKHMEKAHSRRPLLVRAEGNVEAIST